MIKKLILGISIAVTSCTVFADMPYINHSTSETSDRITNGDLTCESRKPIANLNAGVYGSDNNDNTYYYNGSRKDQGLYVGVTIPLYSKSSSVNCDSLYQLSLKKEQLRVEQLELQIEMLKSRRLIAD